MISIENLTAISPLTANKFTNKNTDATEYSNIATTANTESLTTPVADENEGYLRNTTSNATERLRETALGGNNRPRSGAGPPPPKTGVVKGRINLGWQFLQQKCK